MLDEDEKAAIRGIMVFISLISISIGIGYFAGRGAGWIVFGMFLALLVIANAGKHKGKSL